MAERKVLNKYYPPDFDPSKLRSFEKKSVRRMCNVRMMLPMSVRCYTCSNYMYIGTKFNMKVETVRDEDYLGIKVYRFYFKCTQCYAEITFKTDPKNHDYVAEWGASRNPEQWRDMLMAEEEFKELKESEMKDDAMKSLEHRTYDSKREMDILDALDQVKTLNRRQAQVNFDELIEKAIMEKDKEIIRLEDENTVIEAKEKFKKLREKRIDDYNNLDNNYIKNEDKLLNKKVERTEITSDNDSDNDINKEKEFEIMKKPMPKLKIMSKNNITNNTITNNKNNITNNKNTITNNKNTITNNKNHIQIKPNQNSGLNLLHAYDDADDN